MLQHNSHRDHLGSSTTVTNEAGQAIENTTYEPFGEVVEGGTATRYGYEGKEHDTLVGDTDFHFRKYKSDWGIFTQPDTLLQNVYDPQLLNRYAFERNNPYKNVDEDGHLIASILFGAMIGILVSVVYQQVVHGNVDDARTRQAMYTSAALSVGIGILSTGPIAASAEVITDVTTSIVTEMEADSRGFEPCITCEKRYLRDEEGNIISTYWYNFGEESSVPLEVRNMPLPNKDNWVNLNEGRPKTTSQEDSRSSFRSGFRSGISFSSVITKSGTRMRVSDKFRQKMKKANL